MKAIAAIATTVIWLMGCAHSFDAQPVVIETEAQLVTLCDKFAVVSETADAGHPFAFYATQRMVAKVRERAGQMGATHLVWLHRTAHSAAAELYRCPPPQENLR